LVTWNNLWVIGAIGAFGHTNKKHSIASLEPSVMSKTNNWLEWCTWNCFYPFRVCYVKRIHLSLSKCQKLFLVLSFIIHWNVIQFVEVVTMMTLIYEGAMFWDWFGHLFVFLVFGCNWHWLVDNENKSFSLKSWIPNLYPSSVLCSELDVA
jgi:hypothetical protein